MKCNIDTLYFLGAFVIFQRRIQEPVGHLRLKFYEKIVKRRIQICKFTSFAVYDK